MQFYVRERENVALGRLLAVKATQNVDQASLKEYPRQLITHLHGAVLSPASSRIRVDFLARPENLECSWVSFYAWLPGMRNHKLVQYRE